MSLDAQTHYNPSCLGPQARVDSYGDGWVVMAAALGPQARSARVDS